LHLTLLRLPHQETHQPGTAARGTGLGADGSAGGGDPLARHAVRQRHAGDVARPVLCRGSSDLRHRRSSRLSAPPNSARQIPASSSVTASSRDLAPQQILEGCTNRFLGFSEEVAPFLDADAPALEHLLMEPMPLAC